MLGKERGYGKSFENVKNFVNTIPWYFSHFCTLYLWASSSTYTDGKKSLVIIISTFLLIENHLKNLKHLASLKSQQHFSLWFLSIQENEILKTSKHSQFEAHDLHLFCFSFLCLSKTRIFLLWPSNFSINPIQWFHFRMQQNPTFFSTFTCALCIHKHYPSTNTSRIISHIKGSWKKISLQFLSLWPWKWQPNVVIP